MRSSYTLTGCPKGFIHWKESWSLQVCLLSEFIVFSELITQHDGHISLVKYCKVQPPTLNYQLSSIKRDLLQCILF